MAQLHIFNPHHDLALANCSASFKAPDSSLQLGYDLSLLPVWYANEGDTVISDIEDTDLNIKLYPNVTIQPKLSRVEDIYTNIFPWGWDNCLLRYLHTCKVNIDVLPSQRRIDRMRELSHRRTAIDAMNFISEKLNGKYPIPNAGKNLSTVAEIKSYVQNNEEVVLKSPWSSSGKGVFWSKNKLSSSLEGWCSRTIQTQGSVICEPAYEKLQDFALLFNTIDEDEVHFEGYSLFFTERAGIYRGNRLLSNEEIERTLSQWVDLELLHKVISLWTEYIKTNIAPHYRGYLGVDMIIYKEGSELKINPAIELNLRMTMGMVARVFYDRYMEEGTKGWFTIEHAHTGELHSDYCAKKSEHPVVMKEGKIHSGYVSLCPITKDTEYAVTVLVE